jgi:hypothetical protein
VDCLDHQVDVVTNLGVKVGYRSVVTTEAISVASVIWNFTGDITWPSLMAVTLALIVFRAPYFITILVACGSRLPVIK